MATASSSTSTAAAAPGSLETIRADEYVICECVRRGSRLRVHITSPGYYNDANCMFPRDLRVAGRKFRVVRANVKLITSRSKYYYSAGSRAGIEILPERALKIYEDIASPECAICFAAPKDTIIDPCGHFYMCSNCARSVTKCPICRGPITGLVNKSQMQV